MLLTSFQLFQAAFDSSSIPLVQDEWPAWKEVEPGAWGSLLVADFWTLPTFLISKLPIKTIRISVTVGGLQWLVLECPIRTPVIAGPALFLRLRKRSRYPLKKETSQK